MDRFPAPAAGVGRVPVKRADLVLEGGGVKAIGLLGAVEVLADAGYSFSRIAGTSAGAAAGAMIAAMQRAGEPLSNLGDRALAIDYTRFPDRGPVRSRAGPLRPLLDAINFWRDCGLYEGKYLRDWLAGVLADLGVRTFGDLRLPDDPDSDLPSSHRYALVAVAADVTRQRALLLPWDYQRYGLDPDEQMVADAVRMSASIPFYFEPVRLRSTSGGESTIMDGAVFSSYPVTIFDRTDGKPPRWPTFGVRLSARDERAQPRAAQGPIELTLALVESMYSAWDAMHVDDPCAVARSVFVDTSGATAIDFGITREQQSRLLAAGRRAATRFLARWDFADHVARCAGRRPARAAYLNRGQQGT